MNHRSIRAGRLIAAFAVAAVLAGCATGPRLIRTEVTSYNEWATLPADRTYAFARTLEYQRSLEVRSYEDIVRDELALKGFRLVPEAEQANLIVTLRPSVVMTSVRVRDRWASPFGSPFGWYGARGFGWYGPYGAYGPYGSPFFGDFDDYTIDVLHRKLEMEIDARSPAGKRYYEGRVETTGRSESMKAVVPYLVRALFSDFPGNNGQTRRVDVPVEAQ